MKNSEFDKLIEDLDFNIEEPSTDHREKFLQKLNTRNQTTNNLNQAKVRHLWIKIASIAASIVIAILLITEVAGPGLENKADLASISPEMKMTQEFYTGLIEKELNTLENENSPETQKIVQDALNQLKILENEYSKLKKDLKESGKDKRVIYAMIQNFQQRIDLLNNVLTQIENIKTIKNNSHENNII